MAFDAFLKLDTIVGESTDSVFAGDTEIFSFSLGAHNSVTIGSATGGGGGGKAQLSSLSIMKKTDKASPLLFQACVSGQHIATGTVTLRKAGGTALVYLKYGMQVVYVDNIQWSGSAGGDDTPMESISLTYGALTIDYQPQDKTGAKLGGEVHGGWNAQTNLPA